jgi:hypothetical protein
MRQDGIVFSPYRRISNRSIFSDFLRIYMARDRNVNVWQAYVTVMSIVSVACLGALAYVIFSSGTNSKTVEGALEREQKAQTALREENTRRQILESMLGVGKPISESEFNQLLTQIPGDEQLTAATKAHTNNMALFGQGATDRNYTNLVKTLVAELRAHNMQLESAGRRELAQKEDFDSKLAQETKAREMEKQSSTDLSNLRNKELVKYAEDIKNQQEQWNKAEVEHRKSLAVSQKREKDANAKLDEVTKEKGEIQKRLDALVRKLDEIQGEDFQYVQGTITEVSNGGDVVWINLGKADGLRAGVSFGVINSDASRVADAKVKAKIEVVELVGDKLARCKVLSDRAPTTILRGDKIYSPAWQPGRKVEFALMGKMDIDGDGKDDRETVKALIIQNGGKVTLDMPPGGKTIGELTVDTRWLVLGDEFKIRGTELSKSDSDAAIERRKLESQAKTLGISSINLDKLLGYLRGSGSNEVSPMGDAQKPGVMDFRANASPVNTSGRVSELFQNRDGTINRNAAKP